MQFPKKEEHSTKGVSTINQVMEGEDAQRVHNQLVKRRHEGHVSTLNTLMRISVKENIWEIFHNKNSNITKMEGNPRGHTQLTKQKNLELIMHTTSSVHDNAARA
jgi:hypothetical protein